MLCKLDVGLNCGTKSAKKIRAGASKSLQMQHNQKLNTPLEKTYKIVIAKADEEFTDLGNVETQILPLSISHESM